MLVVASGCVGGCFSGASPGRLVKAEGKMNAALISGNSEGDFVSVCKRATSSDHLFSRKTATDASS